jgi:uncharacterized LabA/DUF88 family protein
MTDLTNTSRTVVFVDGQNLFHAAREAFGYTFPNYDPQALANVVCQREKWALCQVCFYTGVPDIGVDPFWGGFWANKLLAMSRKNVWVFSRPLRYRNEKVTFSDGSTTYVLTREEKGIDVRIALDIVRMARNQEFDIALVFSQDQDLSEVADEIRAIARGQERFIKIASAFPVSPTTKNKRGINKTDWIKIDRVTYDSCIDSHDYRPKKRNPPQC